MINLLLKTAFDLSIHIVLGACVCAISIVSLLGIQLNPLAIICLGISVWLIYTIDHLIDAVHLQKPSSFTRHAFHQKYYVAISIIASLFFLTLVVMVSGLPLLTLQRGAFLGFLVLIYFLTYKSVSLKIMLYKEAFISVGFCFGIFIAASGHSEIDLNLSNALIFLQYFCIALLNVLIISIYDSEGDLKDGQVSSVQKFGKSLITYIVQALFVFFIAMLILGLGLDQDMGFIVYQCILMSMALTLFIIYYKGAMLPGKVSVLADLVFLYPVLYLFYF